MTKPGQRAWYSEETGFFGPRYLQGYDSTLKQQDTARQINFIEKTLPLTPGQYILDLACGHGRHSIELALRGYHVVGQDLNGYFLRLARASAKTAGVNSAFIKSDMRHIPFEDTFDAVINMFTAFGYLENDEEDQKVLMAVTKALKPGGKFLIDTINRERVIKNFQRQTWQENEDGSFMLGAHEMDFLSGRMKDTRTFVEPSGTKKTTCLVVRMYTLAELDRMLKTADLTVTAVFGDFEGSAYGIDSPRLIVVSQKQ